MKRIVFFIERLFAGGAERVVASLANEFCRNPENEVHIVVYNQPYEEEYWIDSRVIKHYVKVKNGGKVVTIFRKFLFLKSCIKEIKPYCVFSLAIPKTNMVLYASVLDRSFPLILSERNDPERFPEQRIMRVFRDWTYLLCDAIVFQTKGAKNYFPSRIADRGTIICNPISDALPMQHTGIRRKRIVNFCRIEPQKNIKMLLDAFELFFKKHEDYYLDIFGEGSEKEKLKKYVNNLACKEHVVFREYCANIHNEIKDYAMYVSSSNFEGISNSMLEAIAIGVPTICTDCPPGGARETIQDGINGLLVPVGDCDALSKAMANLADDERLQSELSNNGIKLRNQLSIGNISRQWMEVANSVLGA